MMPKPTPLNATVTAVKALTASVNEFYLQLDPTQPFSFLPGQFFQLQFEVEGKAYKRSYSIASAPTAESQLVFAVSYVDGGVASQFLFDLKPGDILTISGPYGRFILPATPPPRYILIGTGTGVTPYRSMRAQLTQQLAEDPTVEVVLLQGTRTRADLLYADEFLAWSQENTRVRFIACLSRAQQETLAPHECLGHVQKQLSTLTLSPTRDKVYLCGNPNMIDETFTLLTELAFPVSQVVREKYI